MNTRVDSNNPKVVPSPSLASKVNLFFVFTEANPVDQAMPKLPCPMCGIYESWLGRATNTMSVVHRASSAQREGV